MEFMYHVETQSNALEKSTSITASHNIDIDLYLTISFFNYECQTDNNCVRVDMHLIAD